MIIDTFELFCESIFNVGNSDHNAGPPITAKGDPGIGSRGGANGGQIGAEFASRGDVTAIPTGGFKWKYNINTIKRAKDKKREKAIKKLNLLSFDDWLKTR